VQEALHVGHAFGHLFVVRNMDRRFKQGRGRNSTVFMRARVIATLRRLSE
jgi:hypothetical protein